MSKKVTKANSFSYTTNNNLPKLKKYPTEWDMKGLYYKSAKDPQIEKDIAHTERAYAAFVKRYRKSNFTTNPKTLLQALKEINKIESHPSLARPIRYFMLLSALDTTDEAVTKRLNLIGQRLTKADNMLLFFALELAKTPKKIQQTFLKDEGLAPFRYYLKSVFENAKHHLSEPEEKILRLTRDVSYDMWVEATEKMLGHRKITYKGTDYPVNSAFNHVAGLPFPQMPIFWNTLMQEIEPLREIVEHELTAICTKKKTTDELRGYDKPYSASVIAHEDDEKSVEALVDAVSTYGFDLSKRFYKLKARLHGEKKIAYAQRMASIGKAPTIDFDQATEICRDVFYGVNKKYGEIFDRLLTNGQIDVYPKQGKRGGAFMSAVVGQPTQVFLNQVDTIDSLETYAHEMGHAIHSERSKTQPAHYEDYSTTTAETASTLFEGLLFDEILRQSSDKDKVVLLHNKVMRDIATIQRQIAFHNFELEMHTHVREQGTVTHKELNQLMQKHLKAYCGPGVNITELDGNSYIYIGHFRYGFYVYTYTFGTLMSTIMVENFEKDHGYADKIDSFLTAGGSDTVANIFKSIGLNTRNIKTFEHGLQKMEREIALLEKLTKKR